MMYVHEVVFDGGRKTRIYSEGKMPLGTVVARCMDIETARGGEVDELTVESYRRFSFVPKGSIHMKGGA